MLIYFVLVLLVAIPFLALGVLFLVGLLSPNVRRKGMNQLRRPFIVNGGSRREHSLQQQRHYLETEIIRRFPPDE